jgi:hypothetical protein
MSSNYSNFQKEIGEIESLLDKCTEILKKIKPEEREKYENPQYRIWSGNIKDLKKFAAGLDEWLNQPYVAEAKRYLSVLKNLSESPKSSLEEIEKDWKFLSDNIDEIKNIYKQVEDIKYENIKKTIATYALKRITEKDIVKAKNWATNANVFCNNLKKLEDREVESKFAKEVKKDSFEELLKLTSFDEDNSEKIFQHQNLVDTAENIVRNKPAEIGEEAILATYSTKKKSGINDAIFEISEKIEEIRNLLMELEWVTEFTDFNDYSVVWQNKRKSVKNKDLETISEALRSTQKNANNWKESKKREINNAFLRCERMGEKVKKESLKKSIFILKGKKEAINWNKPELKSIYEVLTEIKDLREKLKEDLINKLGNEDAISIIEEPKIIEDLGREKGWDFDRFFEALKIVLRSGIIAIKKADEE